MLFTIRNKLELNMFQIANTKLITFPGIFSSRQIASMHGRKPNICLIGRYLTQSILEVVMFRSWFDIGLPNVLLNRRAGETVLSLVAASSAHFFTAVNDIVLSFL